MSNKNITFTLTIDKADALCSLLSMLDGDNALTGLYRALMLQVADRPYNYRIMQGTRVHRIHKAPMLVMLNKHEQQEAIEEWEDEENGS